MVVNIKERPILFSSPMIRAILDGRKTQTRRLNGLEDVNKIPDTWEDVVLGELGYMAKKSVHGKFGATFKSYSSAIENRTINICPQLFPYGKPGDRLWVRETWQGPILDDDEFDEYRRDGKERFLKPNYCVYRATDQLNAIDEDGNELKWSPSIFMPRWASRILLEVTNIRVERLNDISEEDAIAEGVEPHHSGWKPYRSCFVEDDGVTPLNYFTDPRHSYMQIWESINGQRSWDLNPWVWVIEFKVISNDH